MMDVQAVPGKLSKAASAGAIHQRLWLPPVRNRIQKLPTVSVGTDKDSIPAAREKSVVVRNAEVRLGASSGSVAGGGDGIWNGMPAVSTAERGVGNARSQKSSEANAVRKNGETTTAKENVGKIPGSPRTKTKASLKTLSASKKRNPAKDQPLQNGDTGRGRMQAAGKLNGNVDYDDVEPDDIEPASKNPGNQGKVLGSSDWINLDDCKGVKNADPKDVKMNAKGGCLKFANEIQTVKKVKDDCLEFYEGIEGDGVIFELSRMDDDGELCMDDGNLSDELLRALENGNVDDRLLDRLLSFENDDALVHQLCNGKEGSSLVSVGNATELDTVFHMEATVNGQVGTGSVGQNNGGKILPGIATQKNRSKNSTDQKQKIDNESHKIAKTRPSSSPKNGSLSVTVDDIRNASNPRKTTADPKISSPLDEAPNLLPIPDLEKNAAWTSEDVVADHERAPSDVENENDDAMPIIEDMRAFPQRTSAASSGERARNYEAGKRPDGKRNDLPQTKTQPFVKKTGKNETSILEIHKVQKLTFACKECSFSAGSDSQLVSHVTECHGQKAAADSTHKSGFSCTICKASLHCRESLFGHMAQHRGSHLVRYFVCSHCKFDSGDMSVVEDHVSSSHPDLIFRFEVVQEPIDYLDGLMECPVCCGAFRWQKDFMHHIESSHNLSYLAAYLKNTFQQQPVLASLYVPRKLLGSVTIADREEDFEQLETLEMVDDSDGDDEVDNEDDVDYLPAAEAREKTVGIVNDFKGQNGGINFSSIGSVVARLEKQSGVSNSTGASDVEKFAELASKHELASGNLTGLKTPENDNHVLVKVSDSTGSFSCRILPPDQTKTPLQKTTGDGIFAKMASTAPNGYLTSPMDTSSSSNNATPDSQTGKLPDRIRGVGLRCPLCPFETRKTVHYHRHMKIHETNDSLSERYCCGYCQFAHHQLRIVKFHLGKYHGGQATKITHVVNGVANEMLNDVPMGAKARRSASSSSLSSQGTPGTPTSVKSFTSFTSPSKEKLSSVSARYENLLSMSSFPVRVPALTIADCQNSVSSSEKVSSSTAAGTQSSAVSAKMLQNFERMLPPAMVYQEPVKCPLCDFTNRIRMNMIRHLRTHSDESTNAGPYATCAPRTAPSQNAATVHLQNAADGCATPKTKSPEPSPPGNSRVKISLLLRRQSSGEESRDRWDSLSTRNENSEQQTSLAKSSDQPRPDSQGIACDGSTDITEQAASVSSREVVDTPNNRKKALPVEEYTAFAVQLPNSSMFKCRGCSFTHRFPSKVRRHYYYQHSEIPPYRCGHCAFRAVERGKVVQHCRSVHSDLAPIVYSPEKGGTDPSTLAESESDRPSVSEDGNSQEVESVVGDEASQSASPGKKLSSSAVPRTPADAFAAFRAQRLSSDVNRPASEANRPQQNEESSNAYEGDEEEDDNDDDDDRGSLTDQPQEDEATEKSTSQPVRRGPSPLPCETIFAIHRSNFRPYWLVASGEGRSQRNDDTTKQNGDGLPANIVPKTEPVDPDDIRPAPRNDLMSKFWTSTPDSIRRQKRVSSDDLIRLERYGYTGGNKPNRRQFRCVYCNLTSIWGRRDIRMHVFHVHLGMRLFMCGHCSFGTSKGKPTINSHIKKCHPRREILINDTSELLESVTAFDDTNGTMSIGFVRPDGTQIPDLTQLAEYLSANDIRPAVDSQSLELPPEAENSEPTESSQSELGPTSKFHRRKATKPAKIKRTNSGKKEKRRGSVEALKTIEKWQWKCRQCEFVHENVARVRSHIVYMHLKLKPYSCPICKTGSSKSSVVRAHIEEEHLGSEHRRVVKTTSEKSRYLRSNIVQVPFGVSYRMLPPRSLSSPDETPLMDASQPEDSAVGKLRCRLCKFQDSDNEKVKSHLMRTHLRIQPFSCGHCHLYFNGRCQVMRHTRVSHPGAVARVRKTCMEYADFLQDNVIPVSGSSTEIGTVEATSWRCRRCEFSAETADALITHFRLHGAFHCVYCDFYHRFAGGIRTHCRAKHPDQPVMYKPWIDSSTKEASPFGNDFEFTDPLPLRRETRGSAATARRKSAFDILKQNASVDYDMSLEDLQSFYGYSEAPSIYQVDELLDYAVGIDNGLSRTVKSSGSLAKKSKVKRSKAAVPRAPNGGAADGSSCVYRCHVCPYGSVALNVMRHHIMSHIHYLPFSCPYCTFRAIQSSSITKHVRARHRGQREHFLTKRDDDLEAKVRDLYYRVDGQPNRRPPANISPAPASAPASETSQTPAEITPAPVTDAEDKMPTLVAEAAADEVPPPAETDMPENFGQRKVLYKCSMCTLKTHFRTDMRHHLMRELLYKPFRCDYCSYAEPCYWSMRKHFRNRHPGLEPNVVETRDAEKDQRVEELLQECTIMLNKSTSGASTPAKSPMVKPTNAVPLESLQSMLKTPLKSVLKTSPKTPQRSILSFMQQGPSQQQEQPASLSAASATPDASAAMLPEATESNADVTAVTPPPVLPDFTTPSHSCPHCPYSSPNPKLLRSHMTKHDPFKVKCAYCDYLCHFPSRVQKHVRRAHPGCEPRYVNIGGLESESIPVKAVESVPTSLPEFDGAGDFSTGAAEPQLAAATAAPVVSRRCSAGRNRVVTNPRPLKWKCCYCAVEFSILFNLRRHSNRKHPGLAVQFVDLQTGQTTTDPDYTEGTKPPTAEPPPPPASEPAGSDLPPLKVSLYHPSVSSEPENLSWNVLNTGYEKCRGEKNEYKNAAVTESEFGNQSVPMTHYNSRPMMSPELPQRGNPNLLRYSCSLCPFTASDYSPTSLARHMRQSHVEPRRLPSIEILPWSGYGYDEFSYTALHRCGFCAFETFGWREFRSHVHSAHGVSPPLKCDVCLRFASFSRSAVQAHCYAAHPGYSFSASVLDQPYTMSYSDDGSSGGYTPSQIYPPYSMDPSVCVSDVMRNMPGSYQ